MHGDIYMLATCTSTDLGVVLQRTTRSYTAGSITLQ